MIGLKDKISRRRLVLADKLLTFCLDKRFRSINLVKAIFSVYLLLVKSAYVSEYLQKEKQHYIPKFLLKKFKVEDTGLIYQYTYFELPKTVSIEKEAALVEDLYIFTGRMGSATILEYLLAVFRKNAGRVYF